MVDENEQRKRDEERQRELDAEAEKRDGIRAEIEADAEKAKKRADDRDAEDRAKKRAGEDDDREKSKTQWKDETIEEKRAKTHSQPVDPTWERPEAKLELRPPMSPGEQEGIRSSIRRDHAGGGDGNGETTQENGIRAVDGDRRAEGRAWAATAKADAENWSRSSTQAPAMDREQEKKRSMA